jgi:hypothetical protein
MNHKDETASASEKKSAADLVGHLFGDIVVTDNLVRAMQLGGLESKLQQPQG